MDSDYLASGLLSNRQLTRLASRGGRNRSSTRLPVLGRQLRNGGLHQPPFLFSKPVFPSHQLFPENPRRVPSPGKFLLPDSFQGPSPIKKMSGRWGERPLGRGDGGYCSLKSVRAFRPFHCAREQQDDAQEQTGHNCCRTPENPDNFRLPAQFVFHHIRRR